MGDDYESDDNEFDDVTEEEKTERAINKLDESKNVFLTECRRGNDLGIRALLRYSMPNLASACDKNGQSGLSLACSTGNVGVVRTLVQSGSVDVNFPDNEGNTPLMMASQAGFDEIVRFFLFHMHGEVHVDAQNCSGFTALMKAALHGRTNCARQLVIGGANVTKKDWGRGFRADQWAAFCGMKETATVIRNVAKCAMTKEDVESLQWEKKTSAAADIFHWLECKIARAFKLKQKDWTTEAGAMYHLASSAYNMHSGMFLINYPDKTAEARRKECEQKATYDITTHGNDVNDDERIVVTVTVPNRHPTIPAPKSPVPRQSSVSGGEIPLVRLTQASPVTKRKPRRPAKDYTRLTVPKPVYKKKKQG